MKTSSAGSRRRLRGAVALSGLAFVSVAASADGLDAVRGAVADGDVHLDFRYRYEHVDQDGASRDAGASTLRTRLGFVSGTLGGFDLGLEADHVLVVGAERYNSTVNGRTRYPVVADPDGADLNQAWLRHRGEYATSTLGRQRLNHGRQRFLGGVGWRQNEQTYDALRVEVEPAGSVVLDYAYLDRVHRIFGPEDGVQPAEWDSDSHALRASWTPVENQMVTGYGYWLDFDTGNGPAASSATLGVDYTADFGPAAVQLSWARQRDHGASPVDYEADYLLAEAGWAFERVTVQAGLEVLGSDDGNRAFATPLATLHKFQGWADRFLATPPEGIRDRYLGWSGRAGPVRLKAVWHDFEADAGGADLGRELDLGATWVWRPGFSLQLKGARFDGEGADEDRLKAWLTLQAKL